MPIKKPKTKAAKKKVVEAEMKSFKERTLKSGKSGKIVTNPKQAVAISLSVAGLSKTQVSTKKKNRSGKKKRKK